MFIVVQGFSKTNCDLRKWRLLFNCLHVM